MDYYNRLEPQLLRNAQHYERLEKQSKINYSGSDEDAALYFELATRRTHSEQAFNEFTRGKHLLLKTAIDSVQ